MYKSQQELHFCSHTDKTHFSFSIHSSWKQKQDMSKTFAQWQFESKLFLPFLETGKSSWTKFSKKERMWSALKGLKSRALSSSKQSQNFIVSETIQHIINSRIMENHSFTGLNSMTYYFFGKTMTNEAVQIS